MVCCTFSRKASVHRCGHSYLDALRRGISAIHLLDMDVILSDMARFSILNVHLVHCLARKKGTIFVPLVQVRDAAAFDPHCESE